CATMSNLANIYAELRRKYGEHYTITYSTPPSYLLRFIGAQEAAHKIVLFYKEDSKARERAPTTPTKLLAKSKRSSSTSELDLTGSPLKDDCIVDAIGDLSLELHIVNRNPWKHDEEYHRGEVADKMRAIICSEQFQRGEGQGSVWFLCDGSDFGHTQLLQYEFSAKHFSRGIVSYAGVLPTYLVTSQSLVRQHSMAAGAPPLETNIENCYQVNPNMTLRFNWSTPAPLPLLIDLSACNVVLNQTFRVGDCSPSTDDFMNQLRILVYIREDIVSYHNDEQAGIQRDPVYRCGSGIDMDELRESINKVMTEVSGFGDVFVDGHAECDIEGVVQQAKVRRLSDLTDKLWDLFKSCASYKDLKIAFNMLFQCAVRCNIVNMPTNKNRLAEIISNLANSRLAMPCLSGAEPLELLLEIGLEKVGKDYEFIFTESKVCGTNLLRATVEAESPEPQTDIPKLRKSLHNAVRGDSAPIAGGGMRKTLLHHSADTKQSAAKYQNGDAAGFKNSNFDKHESMMRISHLFQMHCVLEHLLMIHINLNIPNVYADVCSQLLSKQPRLLEGIDDQLSDVVDIQLSGHYVREHLDGKDPHSRQITMKSQNTFRELTTTFYYNLENICPPELAKCFQCDDKELIKERTYHSWIYRKIRTLK
ncbi:hypothetical protein KR222_005683, partial [Zaprionus bogoriensis]